MEVPLKNINIVVLPYRDRYFAERYGVAVRDLHIIQALGASPDVVSVNVFNRPVSLHERILGVKSQHIGRSPSAEFPGVEWIDVTSPDPIGPLFKRRWVAGCYSGWVERISRLKKKGHLNVLLDFTPLSRIPYHLLDFDVIWYDLIDNFAKHNRFSNQERSIVADKYRTIGTSADLITAVSQGALDAVDGASSACFNVLPNGLPLLRQETGLNQAINPEYDFGFMGFVTDKFDVALVARLSRLGYSTAIHGEVYDASVGNQLASLSGVTLFGGFNAADAYTKAASFRVGLIPYLADKRHDESPLKLYQYLAWGRPVMTSAEFEITNQYISDYSGLDEEALRELCVSMLATASDDALVPNIRNSVDHSVRWDTKIAGPLSAIRNIEAQALEDSGQHVP